MRTISIIIPVFNEEHFIQQTIEKVWKADSLELKKEIIVIDDKSTDKTAQIVSSYINKNKDQEIRLIAKKQNEGKGAAVKDGFMASKGDIVLVQDADLEYSPEEYPILLEPFLHNNADVVFGSRFITYRPHRVLYFWHSVANKLLTQFSNMLTNLNLTDMETGYKVFKGDIIRSIAPKLSSKRFGFEPEVTARISKIKGLSIYEVGISYKGRTYEEGKKIGGLDAVKAVYEIIKFNLFVR